MIVTVKDEYDTKNEDLSEFIEETLNGDDHHRGALESARATADNVSTAFANLLTLLVENGTVPLNKVLGIIDVDGVLELDEVELFKAELPTKIKMVDRRK